MKNINNERLDALCTEIAYLIGISKEKIIAVLNNLIEGKNE